MNGIKKAVGGLIMLLGLFSAYFICFDKPVEALKKLTSVKSDEVIFGSILLFVLMPIIVGSMVLFGYYALKGEYDTGVTDA